MVAPEQAIQQCKSICFGDIKDQNILLWAGGATWRMRRIGSVGSVVETCVGSIDLWWLMNSMEV